MKKVSLSGSPRESVGKKDATAIRNAGNVPAVLYGGEKQVHFSVNAIALEKIIYSPDVYQVDLDLAGTEYMSIIKEIQFHPVTDAIIHIDFLQVTNDKPIVIGLPVRTTGKSVGVVGGGALAMNFRKIKAKGLIKDIPEFVEVDITPLEVGDKIRVGQIDLPGIELIQDDSSVVVAVRRTRVAMSEATLEGEEGEEGEEGTEGAEGAEGEKSGGEGAPAAE